MGLFGKLFAPSSESVALIDIGSGSVGGGYARYEKGKPPTLEYGARVPVEPHADELPTLAMLRALEKLTGLLIQEGAPALARASGSGRVGSVLVSVAAPWQETDIRIERVEESTPFTFTKSLMNTIVARTAAPKAGRVISGESVIATMLNGYETTHPFGKKVTLADVVVLSSNIDEQTVDGIRNVLRSAFHRREIEFTAFAPLAYAVFRDVYPHEKDFLVLDVSGEATDIAFVKQGLLMSVRSSELGVRHLTRARGKNAPLTTDVEEKSAGVHVVKNLDKAAANDSRARWVENVLTSLKAFSEEHALPRTLFLLADDEHREYLRGALDDPSLRSLWLSDEPLSILPVVPAHFAPYLKTGPAGASDVFLMLLALFHRKHVDQVDA